MNRNLFQAASAALLCFALAACGGGGGDDSQPTPVPTPPVVIAPTGSSATDRIVNIGAKSNATPSDGWVNPNPIADCTPKVVDISLQGDTIMGDQFSTGKLQALMDTQFGAGSTVVLNYALGGNLSDNHLYVSGDVVVASYGIWDMLGGVTVDHFLHNMQAIAPTLVVTQTPIITEFDQDPTAYLTAVKSMGVPVADAFSYVSSLVVAADPTDPNVVPVPLSSLLWDSIHPTLDLDRKIVENVIAPEVAKQVAPMRCVQL